MSFQGSGGRVSCVIYSQVMLDNTSIYCNTAVSVKVFAVIEKHVERNDDIYNINSTCGSGSYKASQQAKQIFLKNSRGWDAMLQSLNHKHYS